MMSAPQILDREFLEIRAKILEIAASFDRMDRAGDDTEDDPRRVLLESALRVILDASLDRAERIQLIFSREYQDDWQATFQRHP